MQKLNALLKKLKAFLTPRWWGPWKVLIRTLPNHVRPWLPWGLWHLNVVEESFPPRIRKNRTRMPGFQVKMSDTLFTLDTAYFPSLNLI